MLIPAVLSLAFSLVGVPETMPELAWAYPQLPCRTEGERISWQLWAHANALRYQVMEDGLDYDACLPAIKSAESDSWCWWHAAQLNNHDIGDELRGRALHELVRLIGVERLRRGELPDMCPWAEGGE